MKHIIITIASLMICTLLAQAQTEKGSKNVGIGLGLYHNTYHYFNTDPVNSSSSSYQSEINTLFSIGPSYSYFIANGLDLGANLSYTYSQYTNAFNYIDGSVNLGPNVQTGNSFSGIVYLRKYFMYQSKFGVRMGPFAGYSFGNQTTTYPTVAENYNSKLRGYNAGANVDLLYYPAKNVGITATLANLVYNHNRSDNGTRGYEDADNFNLNFITNALSLSVFYVIGAK